jgi:hypothetical protein
LQLNYKQSGVQNIARLIKKTFVHGQKYFTFASKFQKRKIFKPKIKIKMKMKFTKIMMAAAACIALTAGTTMAQNGRFSVGAEIGMPMGDFSDGNGVGFGGSLRYELPMGDKLGLGLTAGYITFGGKSVDDGLGGTYDNPSFSVIPIQAFLKYYFNEQQSGLYGMVDLGVHSSSVKTPEISYTDPISGQVVVISPEETHTSTDLSYAPEIGYHLANLDLGLRYQIISTEGSSTSYLGLRVAYVFGSAK